MHISLFLLPFLVAAAYAGSGVVTHDITRYPDGSVKGTYSYPKPDGSLLVNDYIADKNGFRSSLAPKADTAHPLAHAKAKVAPVPVKAPAVHSSAGRLGKHSSAGRLGKHSSAGRLGKHSSAGRLGKYSSAGRLGKHSSAGRWGKHSSAGRLGKYSSAGRLGKYSSAGRGKFYGRRRGLSSGSSRGRSGHSGSGLFY